MQQGVMLLAQNILFLVVVLLCIVCIYSAHFPGVFLGPIGRKSASS